MPLAALFSRPKGGVTIATTRLISMHQNKGKSIADCLADRTDYAKNPDKTANPNYTEADLQALGDVMKYATNGDKTEKQFFVTGVNCDTATARDEMLIAKAQWNDESEIVCYHGFRVGRRSLLGSGEGEALFLGSAGSLVVIGRAGSQQGDGAEGHQREKDFVHIGWMIIINFQKNDEVDSLLAKVLIIF